MKKFSLVMTIIFALSLGAFFHVDAFAFDEKETETTVTKPNAPTDFTATVSSDSYSSSVTLTWNYDNYYVNGFYIYRATSENGTYELLTTLSRYSTSYTDYNISKCVPYYYKIVAYTYDYYFGEICSDEVVSNQILIPLNQVALQSVTASSGKSMTVNWYPVSDASGYYIYRSTNPDSDFTLICDYINSSATNNNLSYYDSFYENSALSYTDCNLTVGQTYYYKVCPYVLFNGQKYSGTIFSALSDIVRIDATKIKKSASNKPGTNTIAWKNLNDADGYIIYYSTSYDSGYKKLKTIKSNSTTSYTQKKLTNGVAYYYKVFGYVNVKGKKLESIEPETYTKYCDYYTYKDEDYTSRHKRIFGNKNIYKYKNSKQAWKNMKLVKAKVWDINRHGKKYTRTFYLYVHKGVAPSVDKMFKEIYKSKERFPIHDIGCYNWRGNSSTSEHCLGLAFDINSNENYMVQGKQILAGSFWKPKKNKYSIPLKCNLVKILEKYGFSRGFWGERKDYMHFSYFGG